jgi:histidine ammonia-lyase
MQLLRLATLCTGRTGVRPITATTSAAVLNHGFSATVREFGSLGCSGDLAPLSTLALGLAGEGEFRTRAGVCVPATDALVTAGVAPLQLQAKEGLALINGTDGMLGMLVRLPIQSPFHF